MGVFHSFLFAESEKEVLVLSGICGYKTLKNLLFSLFYEEKFHATANGLLIRSLIDTDQVALHFLDSSIP